MSAEGGADRRVTVFGGSGFLGRRIVQRLAADGAEVRIAVRHPERAAFLTKTGRPGQITAVRADVWDEATVPPALAGAGAVVNTVGHYVARGDASFEAIHGQGARHVAAAADGGRDAPRAHLGHRRRSGVRLALRSGPRHGRAPGARRLSRSDHHAPERHVRPDHDFLNRLAGLARVLPVLPLFGAGDVKLQPVYVDDVAAAVGTALATPAAAGKLYELGGPRVYSYKALVQLVLEQTGKRRLLLPLPYFAWNALAALMAPLPARPISRDQVKLMQTDNVVSPGALTFADLGITPTALEAIAPTYLRRHGA